MIRSQHAFCVSCVCFDCMCVIGVTNCVNYICDKCMWKTRSTWGLENIMNMEFNNFFFHLTCVDGKSRLGA